MKLLASVQAICFYHVCAFYLLSFVSSISLDEFFPYGIEQGDVLAPINDDGSTSPIPVSSLFPFFNHQHDTLIVNTNGVISFLGTMRTFTPSEFPLVSKRRIIAPYWTDIDTNNGGNIWYRESTNKSLLQKASYEIHELFPEYYNFQATCTFQCLLITNGRHSFTTYMYNKIEWTTGTASGGDFWGLGGTPAQVGFDAGDGINFYALEASRTPEIINVTRMSNIDKDGKFIFRVDSTTIKGGGCNVEGTLTITPREVTMLGGTRLIISGPCFDHAKNIMLYLADGKCVPCILFTKQSVSCISPLVYRTGKDIVTLNIIRQNDTELSFVGSISFVNHGLTKHLLKRAPMIWNHLTDVSVSWNPNNLQTFIRNASLSLEMYQIQESNGNQVAVSYHSRIANHGALNVESGNHTFNLNFTGKAGLIKISSMDGGPYFWSDVFTVNINKQHSRSVCSEWREKDDFYLDISSSDVAPCPCTLEVANIDISRYTIDPMCRNNDGQQRCSFQPHALLCFKLNAPSRPPTTCLNYVPPRPAGVSGDPHFVTFDGQRYTFNPVGEFTAISSGNFTLQLRMEQVGDLLASSVTSFVARPCPESEPIEVRGNSIRGIDVIVNGTNDEIDWSIIDALHVDGASIEKTSDNPHTVELRFPEEGISIKVTSGTTTNRTVLNLLIFSSSQTKQSNMSGLFGDNDGNSTNDFRTKEDLIVDGNASTSSVHHEFGSTWRIVESESLFTYEGGRSFSSYQDPNFEPLFQDPNVTDDAIDICGDNKNCQFDFMVTGDRSFAIMSAETSQSFSYVADILENYDSTTNSSMNYTSTMNTSITTLESTTRPSTITLSNVSSTSSSVATTLTTNNSSPPSTIITTQQTDKSDGTIPTTKFSTAHKTTTKSTSTSQTLTPTDFITPTTTLTNTQSSTKSPTPLTVSSTKESKTSTNTPSKTNQSSTTLKTDAKTKQTTTTPTTNTKSASGTMQTTTAGVSSAEKSSNQNLLSTVTITVSGTVLVIGVIVIVVVVLVTMSRMQRRKGHGTIKRQSSDLEAISESNDSGGISSIHIKRPLCRPDWVNLMDTQSKPYQYKNSNSYGDGRNRMTS